MGMFKTTSSMPTTPTHARTRTHTHKCRRSARARGALGRRRPRAPGAGARSSDGPPQRGTNSGPRARAVAPNQGAGVSCADARSRLYWFSALTALTNRKHIPPHKCRNPRLPWVPLLVRRWPHMRHSIITSHVGRVGRDSCPRGTPGPRLGSPYRSARGHLDRTAPCDP